MNEWQLQSKKGFPLPDPLLYHTTIESGKFNKGKAASCEIWMPQQDLLMALGDTDSPLWKYQPLNLLNVTKRDETNRKGAFHLPAMITTPQFDFMHMP